MDRKTWLREHSVWVAGGSAGSAMRKHMCMVGLAVMALAGCGKDAPTTGTVEVRGSGQEWSVASSKAETSKDGYNVKVLVKLDPKAEHGEYLPWGIGGDLTSKDDGDESGQGTLKNWCHSDVRHARRWSTTADDNAVMLTCRGTVVEDMILVELHDKAGAS